MRCHLLQGASPPAQVQGASPILVREVGVSSCHQQCMNTGCMAGSAGLMQGRVAPRREVGLCPPPQQQLQYFCVAPAGSHM